MATVRELLISFGAEVDKSSLNKADKQIKKSATGMRDVLSKALQAGFAIGIGKGVLALTKMASDVEETMNVINVSFEDNAQRVLDWSQKFGDAAGRSRFELQKTAADLGALLNPMLEGNAEAATDMSISLAQLSVDLASFFNKADNDVLVALRAGIVGETEPMRRLGVNMLISSLEAFALSKGITKSFKSMTEAEKVTLRYQFLMEKTANAQGDAVRTAQFWANTSKALDARLKDLGTAIGLKLLPFMTKLARGTVNLIEGFLNFAKGTNLIESALLSLASVAAAVAIKILIAFAPVLIPLLKMAAAFAIVTLVVEDFFGFIQGKDSLIGRIIDAMFGPGSAAEAAMMLRQAWQALVVFWKTDVLPRLSDLRKAIGEFFIENKPAMMAFFRSIGEGFEAAIGVVSKFIDWLVNKAVPALTGFGAEVGLVLGSIRNWFFETFDPIIRLIDKFRAKISGFVDLARGKVASFLGLPTFGFGEDQQRQNRAPTVFSPAAVAAGAGAGGNAQVDQTINVNVQGNATPETASRIGTEAGRATRDTNRKTLAALTQRAS